MNDVNVLLFCNGLSFVFQCFGLSFLLIDCFYEIAELQELFTEQVFTSVESNKSA